MNAVDTLRAETGIRGKWAGILLTAVKMRPDCIHFDWIESYYFRRWSWLTWLSTPFFLFQVWIAAKIFHIRMVWTLHNLSPHDKRQLRWKYFVQRRFARYMDSIRVLSPESIAAAAHILSVPEKKCVFISTGSFTDYYPDTTDRQAALEHLGLPGDKRILLTQGSIRPYKGMFEWIKIFRRMNRPGIFLLIAGRSYDDAYLEKLKKEAGENVRIDNRFIPVDELQYYFHAADLVVLPFLEVENSGSVVLAAGFAKAIVAPRSPVLNFRLKAQPALLYADGDLQRTVEYALGLSEETLNMFGVENYEAAQRTRWETFGLYLAELLSGKKENEKKQKDFVL